MTEGNNAAKASRIAQTIASDCVGARIRMLNRAISRIYDEEVRSHGIRFSQMNILTVVTLHGPIRPVDVGRLLSLEKSTLSRNVGLMEAKGWLASRSGEGNSRLLEVTARGRRLLKGAEPAWRAAQARVTALLGEAASAELRRAADRIGESAT